MLDVSNALKYPGQAYPLRAEFTIEPMQIMGDTVALENVAFEGEYFSAEETINLRGVITALARSNCAKCLAPVDMPMRVETGAVFSRGADDCDEYPLAGHEIDVEPALREALILALPMRFLCGADCKGLCPTCGANRNTDQCACTGESDAANPFYALSSLLPDHDDEEV